MIVIPSKECRIMNSILIISSDEKSVGLLRKLLSEGVCEVTDSAPDIKEGLKMLSESSYDLVIINAPVDGSSAPDAAVNIVQSTGAFVLLTVKNELEQEIQQRVGCYGIVTLGKPLSKALFYKTLQIMDALKNRISGIERENEKLHKKIEDTRLINRAKGILMEYLQMTEMQAHKYLERQAMDLRLTKAEVARRLLSTYES